MKYYELTKEDIIKVTKRLGDIFWKAIERKYWYTKKIDDREIMTAILSIHYRLENLEKSLSTSQSEGTELSSSGSPDGSPKDCYNNECNIMVDNECKSEHDFHKECKKRRSNPSDD